MLTYVVRRLLYGVLTFFGITVAVFVLVHSVPGDPISFYVGSHGMQSLSHAALDEIRHEHHLDESILRQYGWWLRGIVTLDFGTSFIDHRPVTGAHRGEAAEHVRAEPHRLPHRRAHRRADRALERGAIRPARRARLGRGIFSPLLAAELLGGAAADAALRRPLPHPAALRHDVRRLPRSQRDDENSPIAPDTSSCRSSRSRTRNWRSSRASRSQR